MGDGFPGPCSALFLLLKRCVCGCELVDYEASVVWGLILSADAFGSTW